MVTVAHLVKDRIHKTPFLEEALGRGVINYAALAEEMKPDMEKALKKEVKTSAIAMALRRQAESMASGELGRAFPKFFATDITIKSDLFEMTFLKSPRMLDNVRKLYNLVEFSRGEFLTVTQGLYEITVISSKRHKKDIQKTFEAEKVLKTFTHLSSLTVRIPAEAAESVGFLYLVTKALNWENINIVEIVSTLTELTFILKEDDVARAFAAVKELIEANEPKAE